MVGRCSINLHRRRTVTLRAIKAFLYRKGLEEDFKQFFRMCLHCIGSLNFKVPRLSHFFELVPCERTDHHIVSMLFLTGMRDLVWQRPMSVAKAERQEFKRCKA